MVKAAPSAAFKMPEPDLLLEFLIITLNAPTQLGGVNQIAQRNVSRQGREPVLGRFLLALGPLDQQPFLGRFPGTVVARCNMNTHACKPRGQRSEERRVGKSVDLGGRRIIKKKKKNIKKIKRKLTRCIKSNELLE